MVPGGGLTGISGVESGNAAALVNVLPGADVHEPPAIEPPSGDAEATVPVELPATEPMMVTGTAAARIGDGVVVVLIGDDMVAVVVGDSGVIQVTGAAPGMAVVPIELIAAIGLAGAVAFVDVTLITEGDSSTIMGAQFTLVPGIVGFCASGGEARLVAGAPGTVAAEKRLVNGPGPVSGDDTIAPGVVGTPMAVVPMVETCARQLLTLSSSTLVV
jgi:hypothetical protein